MFSLRVCFVTLNRQVKRELCSVSFFRRSVVSTPAHAHIGTSIIPLSRSGQKQAIRTRTKGFTRDFSLTTGPKPKKIVKFRTLINVYLSLQLVPIARSTLWFIAKALLLRRLSSRDIWILAHLMSPFCLMWVSITLWWLCISHARPICPVLCLIDQLFITTKHTRISIPRPHTAQYPPTHPPPLADYYQTCLLQNLTPSLPTNHHHNQYISSQ